MPRWSSLLRSNTTWHCLYEPMDVHHLVSFYGTYQKRYSLLSVLFQKSMINTRSHHCEWKYCWRKLLVNLHHPSWCITNPPTPSWFVTIRKKKSPAHRKKKTLEIGRSLLEAWNLHHLGLSENVGYIPNEIAIFHRDNDQQNHWVPWGTQHFQTKNHLKTLLETPNFLGILWGNGCQNTSHPSHGMPRRVFCEPLPSGNDQQFANLNIVISFVDWPTKKL